MRLYVVDSEVLGERRHEANLKKARRAAREWAGDAGGLVTVCRVVFPKPSKWLVLALLNSNFTPDVEAIATYEGQVREKMQRDGRRHRRCKVLVRDLRS